VKNTLTAPALISCFLIILAVRAPAQEAKQSIPITSIVELQQIGNHLDYPLDAAYLLTQDIDASATAAWNAGAGFNPIGNAVAPFTGHFDGAGHVVQGLFINRPTTDNVGLFGYVAAAGIIERLGLEGGAVSGEDFVGHLAGRTYGAITLCYATGDVSGVEEVGGLVGVNHGQIQRCRAAGHATGDLYVGGLAGRNTHIITRSYATGAAAGNMLIGGLIGNIYAPAAVSRCFATGAATATGLGAGGLIGTSTTNTTVAECYATGRVTGSGYTGGLVGLSQGSLASA